MTLNVNGTAMKLVYVDGVLMERVSINGVQVYVEATAQNIMSFLWTNRASLILGSPGGGGCAWLGDSYTVGGPHNRYVGSDSISAGISNPAFTTLSATSTLVSWAAAAGANIYSVTSSPAVSSIISGPTRGAADSCLELCLINTPTPSITTASTAWTRQGDNIGSWAGMILIPGTWAVAVDQAGLTAGTVLAPGEMSIIIGPSQGDGPAHVPGSGISTSIAWTSWWYNSYGFQMNVNTTGGNLSQVTGLSGSYRYIKLYKP